jgi:hypothetical protein
VITGYDLQVSSHIHWRVKIEPGIVCLDHRGPLQGYIAYCSESNAEGHGLTEADAFESFISNAFPAPVNVPTLPPPPASPATSTPSSNVRQFPLRGRMLERAITGERAEGGR